MKIRNYIIITLLFAMTMSSCILISTTRSRSEQDKKILKRRENGFFTTKKHHGPSRLKVWVQRKKMLRTKGKLRKSGNDNKK